VTLHAIETVREQALTRDELAHIVEAWQHRLQLDHWSIQVDWDTAAEDGCTAQIKPWHVYDYATIRLSHSPEKGWTTWPRLIANRNVVHELLHLALRDVEYAHATGELVMAANVWKLFDVAVENASEAAIDRLATVLVDLAGLA
jgi:hypothetical protein